MKAAEQESAGRGSHRSEPEESGPLATVGHMLDSTVPRHVAPPKPLRVLLMSALIIGLALFGYSTTQVYLRFTGPAADQPVSGADAAEQTSGARH